jgi:hypothetical protein
MNDTPAFPSFEFHQGYAQMMPVGGMTLRDYFAAKAMQSLAPQYRAMFMDNTLENWEEEAVPALAEEAYSWADAMMKAREA